MAKPRKGSYRAAAEEIRVLEAVGGAVVPEAAQDALSRVDQSLPVAERLRAETLAVNAAGGGYERVVALSREIVEAGLSFADIGPADTDPPPAWVQTWGVEGATRRFRVARAAWLPSREAPSAIAIATDVLKMDARVKAASKGAPLPQLNVAIQLNITPRTYPEEEENVDEG